MLRSTLPVCLFHLAVSLVIMATTTPGAAQVVTRGPITTSAAPPTYVPAPRLAARPAQTNTLSGVSYRASTGVVPARTNLGSSAHDPVFAPAIWSGLYVGGHGSYVMRETTTVAPTGGATSRGVTAGAHLGYNWQVGRLVFGGEVDGGNGLRAAATPIAPGVDLSVDRAWTASLRARAGVALGSVLAYGTAGVAVAGQSLTLSDGVSRWRLNDVTQGFVYGAGLEWRVSDRINLRGEVLRYDFADQRVGVGAAARALQFDETVVRGGLSYRFN